MGEFDFIHPATLHSGIKCPSSFPITLPDERQFTLTPELLTIERKQLKQSSKLLLLVLDQEAKSSSSRVHTERHRTLIWYRPHPLRPARA